MQSKKNSLLLAVKPSSYFRIMQSYIYKLIMPSFLEFGKRDGFDIRLCFQPPNNPYLNVLVLGFFRSINSFQHQEAPTIVNKFVSAVEHVFYILSITYLNNVLLTLQTCMFEVLKVNGGNHYKVQHMSKEKLPNHIEYDSQVLTEAMTTLEE